MSLVAYGSSDEGSENEDIESVEKVTVCDTDNDKNAITTVRTNTKLTLPAPIAVAQSINDEEEEKEERDNDGEECKHLLDKLPKPISLAAVESVEEDDDIPLKREIKQPSVKPAKRQTVRITVPSLSEFNDIEEEQEKKPARIVEPLQKSCGLFTLLVPPKSHTVGNKILIPQTVKHAAVKANIPQLKAVKISNANKGNNSKIEKAIVDKSHNESSSDDEDDTVDFFGLTTSKDLANTSMPGSLDSGLSSNNVIETTINEESSLITNLDYKRDSLTSTSSDVTSSEMKHPSKTLTSNVMNLPREEILLKNKAEIGPKLPVPEQEYNIDTDGNVAFDEKAIEYLYGKRGVKRKERELNEANIIEINEEDIKPDEREWLVKALTEEPVQRPISMQSCGVNSPSKKKHQITYLAHQAKAMEIELKNQWSQNRMTRKQTKSKYGF